MRWKESGGSMRREPPTWWIWRCPSRTAGCRSPSAIGPGQLVAGTPATILSPGPACGRYRPSCVPLDLVYSTRVLTSQNPAARVGQDVNRGHATRPLHNPIYQQRCSRCCSAEHWCVVTSMSKAPTPTPLKRSLNSWEWQLRKRPAPVTAARCYSVQVDQRNQACHKVAGGKLER